MEDREIIPTTLRYDDDMQKSNNFMHYLKEADDLAK
jgi:hypothetical protein